MASPAARPVSRTVHVILAASVLMATMDLTVVNVAMPAISADLNNASLSALSWVLNAYAIVYASTVVPAGRLADRGSRRTAFLIGLGIFTVASAGCALAPSLPVLIAARVIQAIGAAALVPSSLSLLLVSYPPEERHRAVRAWTAVGGVGVASGPLIGGLLVNLSWRPIFLVNVPIGVACLIAGRRRLPEARVNLRGPLPDLFGSVLLVAGIGLLSLALVQANDWGWTSQRVWILIAFTLALIGWFLDRSSHHPSPVISMDLMRLPGVAAANLGGLFFAISLSIVVLSITLWCQNVWGWSALITGLALIPGNAFLAITPIFSGKLTRQLGPKTTVTVGCGCMAAGSLWWVGTMNAQPRFLIALLPGLLLTRIGVGLAMPGVVAAAISNVPPGDLTTGAAINNMIRQLGLALGFALYVLLAGRSTGIGARAGFDHSWILAAVTALLVIPTIATVPVTRKVRQPAIPAGARPGEALPRQTERPATSRRELHRNPSRNDGPRHRRVGHASWTGARPPGR